MTDDEFSKWIAGYIAAFPDFKSWFLNIPPSEKGEMTTLWRDAMRDVELRDAKAVTARIASGDDTAIPAYERELTAAKIRKLAKENYQRRNERSRKREEPIRRQTPRGQSAGGMYRAMLALMDDNPDMTAKEAADVVIPKATESERRYDCHLCLDTGIVLVWSQRSVRAAVDGKLDDPNNRRACGCPCSCRFGDARIFTGENPPRGWSGWRSHDLRYTDDRYCLCPFADTENAETQVRFKDWAAEKYLVWQNSKRVPEFDNWNNRA